jgi:hypothetical protein
VAASFVDADRDAALAKALNPFSEQGNLMLESTSVKDSGAIDCSWLGLQRLCRDCFSLPPPLFLRLVRAFSCKENQWQKD